MMQRKPGVLVLEDPENKDGVHFPGELFGFLVNAESILASAHPKDAARGLKTPSLRDGGFGEVVFNTSMAGYQEILTDPSYYGQIVCLTVPHVGNTGVNFVDPESAHPWCAGFVVHDFTETPSNWRSEGTFEDYLLKNKIPGITGVDTRALTRFLRSRGVLRGVILPAEEAHLAMGLLKKLPAFEGRDLIAEVTTKEPYRWPHPAANLESATKGSFGSGTKSVEKNTYTVVALDFGVKWNLLRNLAERGCDVHVLPANATADEILKFKPDGLFLSNGPGDPSAAPYAAETVRKLLGKLPMFGVCMGHQILSIALGGKTFKLKFGHRGGNQPVMSSWSNQVEITSQNHGYAVDTESLPKGVEITHVNLNDRTCEGIRVKDQRVFSVQYHPEACPGPHDSNALFDVFIEMMNESRQNKNRG
jgi:carbamoyl-phosphate synthase small subunit